MHGKLRKKANYIQLKLNLFILMFDLHLGGPCVALFDSENYGRDSSIEDGKASNLQVECVGICWNLESV